MSKRFDAVAAGHICLDVVPNVRSTAGTMFLPGRLTEIGPVTLSTGGPVSNAGLALFILGVDTQLMGKVGDDLFGDAVRRIVASYDPGLADGMVIDPTAQTSYTVVLSPTDVDRIFLHYPGANDTFGAEDVRYDLLSQARLFHFGYPPVMKLMFENDGQQLTEVFRRAKETGITTSLDMAVPDPSSDAGKVDWLTIIESTLPYVDVFLPSIEEILYMVRRDMFDDFFAQAQGSAFLALITPQILSDLSQQLLDMGARIIALKMGDRGVYVRTAGQAAIQTMGRARPSNVSDWANREMWTACFQANFVGAAGSGDATIAGFLAGLLRDLPLVDALTAATAVGACNVEAADTLSGLRPWDETLQRVKDGWPRHQLELDAPGWEFDGQHQIWIKVN
jgi:sugar/nucleoside kinase (ribokinase family)